MNELKRIEKYIKKYSLGLIERKTSLKHYNELLEKIEEGLSFESLISDFLEKKPLVRVFEIGCGEAQALKELKVIFKNKVFVSGIDLLETDFQNLDELIIGDVLEQVFPQNCDIIFSFKSLHEIGSTKQLIEKIESSLTNGGVAILSIRVQEFKQGELVFLGELTQEDLDFLNSILQAEKFKSCLVSGSKVFLEYNGVQFLAGINLILMKQVQFSRRG